MFNKGRGEEATIRVPQFRGFLLSGLYLSIVIQIKRYDEYYGVTLLTFLKKKGRYFRL